MLPEVGLPALQHRFERVADRGLGLDAAVQELIHAEGAKWQGHLQFLRSPPQPADNIAKTAAEE
jgi:hypothetical protein